MKEKERGMNKVWEYVKQILNKKKKNHFSTSETAS